MMPVGGLPLPVGVPTQIGPIAWNATHNLPSAASVNGAAYGNGQYFVFYFGSATAYVSNDGINWTPVVLPSASGWSGAAWNGGTWFLFANDNAAATSPDGINWTAQAAPFNAGGLGGVTVSAIGGIFYTFKPLASNQLYKSNDGINWVMSVMPAAGSFSAPVFNGTVYFAYDYQNGSTGLYSNDGANWFVTAVPLGFGAAFPTVKGATICIAGNSGQSATSTDGFTWAGPFALPAGFGSGLSTATLSNFVMTDIGTLNHYAYSTDGQAWNIAPLPLAQGWFYSAVNGNTILLFTYDGVTSYLFGLD